MSFIMVLHFVFSHNLFGEVDTRDNGESSKEEGRWAPRVYDHSCLPRLIGCFLESKDPRMVEVKKARVVVAQKSIGHNAVDSEYGNSEIDDDSGRLEIQFVIRRRRSPFLIHD